MSDRLYNRENFNEIKESLGLTNKDISKIVDLTPGTVKNQVSPSSKKLSTWMRALIFMWDRQKQLEEEMKKTDALNKKLIQDNRERIIEFAEELKLSEAE